MSFIIFILQILAIFSGSLVALLSVLLFLRLRWPAPVLFILKLFASALSPVMAAVGVLSTVVGLTTGSVFITMIGIVDVLVFCIHMIRVTRPPQAFCGFEQAFGSHWKKQLRPAQKDHFLSRREILKLPGAPTPRLEQNLSFAVIPGTDRQLLCDIWQPPEGISPSGLAFIYLHGSAWFLLDKDLGTRPFFSHLAAQGHVIMDIAYRLAPETDMMGMVNDAKRAIVWMKENAGSYGVKPERVMMGGGSAGGHLALLAAYTADNPQFTPCELEGKDFSVSAVISLYGPTDLEACYYHTNQHLTTRSTPDGPQKAAPTHMPEWMIKGMGDDYHRLAMDKGFENAGALAPLLGGHPDECPETYALYSPVTHVHPGCPPTLLMQGEHDIIAPVKATRLLHARLVEEKVLAVMHLLPQTDHAFDLILPKISPSAHTAFYDVERFMAMMV